ncbi:hypothetical protein J437_LFUL009604, partial [Ladona fulva]
MYLNQLYFWVYPSGIFSSRVIFCLLVGAGTAGVTIATRLSEDSSKKVLLLEAGDKGNLLLDIPFLIPLLQSSHYNWQYNTEPQKHACFGLSNNSSKWPRGKVVGGSSRLNYAVYVRGQKHDFESWSEQGNDGWDYHSVLPYLKKSENQKGRFKYDGLIVSTGVYHSVKGELSVDDPSWVTPMAATVLSASAEIGLDSVDINAEKSSGFMLVQTNLENGKRCGSDSAFLKRASERENLKVVSNAHVEKVLFEDGHKANAVVYTIKGTKYIAEVNKEIILSAGAIETPKILMLSGIGPKDHLKSFDIPVLLDLPVGKNLHDHVTTGTDLILLSHQIVSLGTFASPVWAEYFQPLIGKQTATISPVLLRPKSRGEILLRSTNPFDPPKIDPKYLSHPDDVKILVEGLQFVEKLVKTESMRKLGAYMNDKAFPGCEEYEFGSVSYWECYVRHLTLTCYHPVGTCKMGPINDHSAVVDSQL